MSQGSVTLPKGNLEVNHCYEILTISEVRHVTTIDGTTIESEVAVRDFKTKKVFLAIIAHEKPFSFRCFIVEPSQIKEGAIVITKCLC